MNYGTGCVPVPGEPSSSGLYIPIVCLIEVFCISGVNALSEYSMLNKEKMTLMPLQKKKALNGCKSGQTRKYGETRIEIWRYNPCFFSKNGIVDKLSLFLAR
ncbi:hypothetical protein NXW09_29630 [Bacteroides ovatus]|nr:hypothetical protein [Bacteroides ovatus]